MNLMSWISWTVCRINWTVSFDELAKLRISSMSWVSWTVSWMNWIS